MRHCPYCSNKIKFTDVLKATNPARIKCSHCRQRIAVSTAVAIAGSVVAGVLSILVIVIGLQAGLSGLLLLMALVALGLLVEAVYYFLIINGVISIRALPAKPTT